ncbi:helix-turn-helix transcriptional regulator [Haloarcula nitratireducens]|uniref:MarR family transcriptional regulator n=1 Tax=Haloarcula nitratireducens TaxID=2487749 RepID=A0AAW4PKK8_9EURY|nr:MarR family transcriptional regulator [Halomicroarcula nitratireducens]MBX0297971.1 MarR family transcriptional regulator [Halomicroarcula nitratireducens]
MANNNKESAIADIAYLARSEHRAPTLVALTVRPRSRSELWELTSVSSSTIRRTLREFEDRNWIRRKEYQYEVTPLGAYIASAVAELIERVEIERKVRDVWPWLPDAESGFSIEMCADAVVTVAEADNPYAPVNRFLTLIEDTDRFRFVGTDIAIFEPNREELCERVIDGMETEIIHPPSVASYYRSTYPELLTETLASGNLTMRLHDELPPYGIGIFDDRIAICGHDSESVSVRVLLDTDSADAREWAESKYDFYRRQTPTIPLETVEN